MDLQEEIRNTLPVGCAPSGGERQPCPRSATQGLKKNIFGAKKVFFYTLLGLPLSRLGHQVFCFDFLTQAYAGEP